MVDYLPMNSSHFLPSFRHVASDIPAGAVVFLVALPLCLGIALASGAPLMSGLIAGIIGGTILALFSGSELSVSGPAAGLAVIVLGAIEKLGSFEIFLVSVVLAGVLQIVFGQIKAGILGEYVPNSVIRGMLAGIGVVIIVKQLSHLVGWDAAHNTDESGVALDHFTSSAPWESITSALQHVEAGPAIIGISCLAFLFLWDMKWRKSIAWTALVPGPLLAVILGTTLNQVFLIAAPELSVIDPSHLVAIPSDTSLAGMITTPDFTALGTVSVWTTAITIAIVASVETLLSVEAADKLDPQKRISDSNQELRAQGIGNVLSGLLGGLPITAVIVRSSTNIYAGGKTRLSAMVHGVLLLVCVLLIPDVLNLIPLAALAAVLISVGYKLTSLAVIRESWEHGVDQFVPFLVTILAVVFTDLLTGIGIGLLVSFFWVIKNNHHSAITLVNDGEYWMLRLNKDATFVNKSELKRALRSIPDNAKVMVNGTGASIIDHDIYDTLGEFAEAAEYRKITIQYHNVFGKRKQ